MVGFVVLALWFMLGRLAAVPLFAMAIIIRLLDTSSRTALTLAVVGVLGLVPAVGLYATSTDPWLQMSTAGGGPWLDVADAVLLLAAVITLAFRALATRPSQRS